MFAAAALLAVTAVLMVDTNVAEFKRVCYVSNWSQYRPLDGMFKPPNIDPKLCSHLVYAFATLNTNNDLAPFEWNDDGSGGLYEQFNSLKTANPGLKTLIAVGGWNFGMDKVVIMLSSAANRQRFVDQSVAYCRTRNFDGLDLDFEYPANRGSPPEDKQNYVLLVQALRAAFNDDAVKTGKPTLLLSAAVAAGKSTIDTGFDVSSLSKNLDFVNLMAYDFNGAWDNQTGINAPLYPRFDEFGTEREFWNLDFAANYWTNLGCPKEKLVLGMGVYGRCFTLKDPAVNGLGAPVVGPCENGTYTREAGFLSFYEICDMQKLPGAVTVYDNEQAAPYTYRGDQWVGYDDVRSLTTKVNYMMSGGYGGAMIWNIDLDDFTGSHCNQGRYPLLTAINNAIKAGVQDTTTTTKNPITTTTTAAAGETTTTTTTQQPTTTLPASGDVCAGKPSGVYANPTSCTSMLTCSNGIATISQCQPGLYFNPDSRVCDWSYNLSASRRLDCQLTK